MKLALHLILLSIFISFTYSKIYRNFKDNVVNYLQRSLVKPHEFLDYKKEKNTVLRDTDTAHSIVENLKKLKGLHDEADKDQKMSHKRKTDGHPRQVYIKDPVLNMMSRRKSAIKKKKSLSSTSGSSSLEIDKWKAAWKKDWVLKKFEAINSSQPRGDTVNMVAARPWGVPCGDPNQHDMPWGSCMLPMECEPEFRIYRGDYFCGRTQFICCALQLTQYDMYQGFDASFEDSELATDSAEKRERDRGSKEAQRRKRRKEKRRRRDRRLRRKRKIKRNINKILKEIRKILSRTYRNGTQARKKKTKQLKKFIDNLKDQYKKDRHAVKDIHLLELEKIDKNLQRHLDQISGLNKDFSVNSTFRDIVVNGTVSTSVARMLMESYPELVDLMDNVRRSNQNAVEKSDVSSNFDVEYGLLYY